MPIRDMDHYCKIKNATCKIDARPPDLKADTFLRASKMRADNKSFKRIINENIILLEKINRIQRIEGEVKCYNRKLGTVKTRIPNIKKWLNSIDEANYFLGKKLLCMKPTMNTRSQIKLPQTQAMSKEQEQVRKALYRKYESLIPIQEPSLIGMFLFPKVFIDLGVKDVRPLDRLVITLFTEAAPNVVLEFVRMCKTGESQLTFQRIFPNLWMEGQIAVPPGSEIGTTQKKNQYIDHGQVGTLSLLERKTKKNFQFSISFKPLKVLNGQRVAFGKVVEGLKILAAVEDYGTKNGKVQKEIVVTNCGLVS